MTYCAGINSPLDYTYEALLCPPGVEEEVLCTIISKLKWEMIVHVRIVLYAVVCVSFVGDFSHLGYFCDNK